MGKFRRYDFGKIDSFERTSNGGLRIPSFLTRAGIFEYRTADGSVVRELRPPEEVFAADSLASLRGVPVTDLHPPTLVTADDWKEKAAGHVADNVEPVGEFVAADLVIQDAALVRLVEAGQRKDLSCGYTMDTEETPGVWNGQPYDRIQRNIRYNHVALGPAGWGRAGPDVSLRLDSGDACMVPETKPKTPPKSGRKVPFMFPKISLASDFRSIRVDGVDYRLDNESNAKQAEAAVRSAVDRARSLRADLDEAAMKSALEEATGILTALQQSLIGMALATAAAEEKAAAAEEKAADAEGEKKEDEDEVIKDEEEAEKKVDPAVLDSIVSKRITLLDRARQIAPKAKFDGMSERAIMEAAIKAANPQVKFDSKDSIDFVRGMFQALSSQRNDSVTQAGIVTAGIPGTQHAEERNDAEDPIVKHRKAVRDAWKRG